VTEVAFHFGAPDKLEYVCRLLRKATGRGAKVVVLGPQSHMHQLDAKLWALSPTDFLAHSLDGGALQARSPVVLTTALHDGLAEHGVLVNLTDAVPEGFEQFARVIEVVSTNEADRSVARGRWRQYAQQGITIQKHDLNLKGAG
jgi:DNA polymerase-3 subunit chi